MDLSSTTFDDQDLLALSADPMSFSEAELAPLTKNDFHTTYESLWGPAWSPVSSFSQNSSSCSTPPGYSTPASSMSSTQSRRQSIASSGTSLRATSLLGSRCLTNASVPPGYVPMTPVNPFAVEHCSPTDWAFIEMPTPARPIDNGRLRTQPVTPESDHGPQRHQQVSLQRLNTMGFSSWSAEQSDLMKNNMESCKSAAIHAFHDANLSSNPEMDLVAEALRQSNSGEEEITLPLTVVPSDTFNIGTNSPITMHPSALTSPSSTYPTSPATEADSYESDARGPNHDNVQKPSIRNIKTEENCGPSSGVPKVDMAGNTLIRHRARMSKRSSTRRARLKGSQSASCRTNQSTGDVKILSRSSKRSHRCDVPSCERAKEGFERIEHLTRHKQSVHGESDYQCRFGSVCRDKKFTGRRDNLNAHYTKTHFFIDHPETKGRRRRWVGRDEQNKMGLGDIPRECDTLRGKQLLLNKGLIQLLPNGSFTEYQEKRA